MTTQSIIVYRNPVEAAFWESGMLFPLIGGLGVGFFSFLILMWLVDQMFGMSRMNAKTSNAVMVVVGIVSVIAGAFTLQWLLI